MVSVWRSSSRPTRAPSTAGRSDIASRVVALVSDSVSSGSGNQTSRTDPSEARVARPIPAAPVTMDKATWTAEESQNRVPNGCGRAILRLLATVRLDLVLDLHGDPVALTAALVDIPSESRNELRIADEVEAALRAQTSGFE